MRPAAPKPLLIPWSRNQLGQPKKPATPTFHVDWPANATVPTAKTS